MNLTYCIDDKTVLMKNFDSFNISEILECGQCFRFEKIDENYYSLIAHNKILYIKQSKETVEFSNTNEKDFNYIWINYFDLYRDYSLIKTKITKEDYILKKAVDFAQGIRILNQDTFEILISFIISQNNRIPQIKQVIKNISNTYGNRIEDTDHFAFPTLKQLSTSTIDQLSLCKTGFRAKYIRDALDKINDKTINISKNNILTAEELKKQLMLVNGIGSKVADCILLFGFSIHEYFPVDVWIKRIMEELYFNSKETSMVEIHSFAKKQFGEYAGFAQQYLFHFARTNNIAKSTKK